MGVAGQILEDIFRPAERWFGVDHPLGVVQRAEEGVKLGGLSKRGQLSVELEFPVGKGVPQQSKKLAAEEPA
jgi:hypothetical protein